MEDFWVPGWDPAWSAVLEKRIRAKRQILFSKEDAPIRNLMLQIDEQPRKAVILWALEQAEEAVRILEDSYPEDNRARNALAMTELWAEGIIKMPIAKRAILDCHAAAKCTENLADAALYHAVGQACGTVHANGHAVGYPIYALTAMIRETGLEQCDRRIESQISMYTERLLYWRAHYQDEQRSWAAFIRD